MPAAAKTPRKKPTDTQNRLIEAGLRLLSRGLPAAQLSATAACKEARCQAAALSRSFGSLEDYLAELLKRLSEEVRIVSVQAIGRKTPSPELIHSAIPLYLDAVLQRPALLELSSMLRTHPVCQQITRDRMSALTTFATLQMMMAKVEHAEAMGQLGMAMLFEVTYAEYEARRSLPEYRHTIQSYFEAKRA